MKKLGLVGGLGPESTIPYYHGIVYGVQRKVGRKFFPNITIESIDVFKLLSLCDQKKYKELTEYLLKAINNLYASGADFAAIAANTPHIVFDELQKVSPIPLVSIVEAVCNEVKHNNINKVGLMGTIFTMEGEFFRKPFIDNNIAVITPTEKEKQYINEKISSELELGIVKTNTQDEFLKILQRMKDEDSIEAVILGCTELPLIFKGVDVPVQCFDTMEIHINTLVNMIIG